MLTGWQFQSLRKYWRTLDFFRLKTSCLFSPTSLLSTHSRLRFAHHWKNTITTYYYSRQKWMNTWKLLPTLIVKQKGSMRTVWHSPLAHNVPFLAIPSLMGHFIIFWMVFRTALRGSLTVLWETFRLLKNKLSVPAKDVSCVLEESSRCLVWIVHSPATWW